MTEVKTNFTARSVAAAVRKAAKAHDTTPEELKYTVLAGQDGGLALVKVLGDSPGAASAGPMVEKLSGEGGPPLGDDELPPRRSSRRPGDRDRDRGRDDRGRGRGRDDRGRDDRGRGRGRDDRGRGRGRRDRDDRGRGGRRGDRDRDRGRGRGGRRPRGRPQPPLPIVPADGPTEVVMKIAEGVTLSEIGEDAHEVLRDILTGMGFGMTVEMNEEEEAIRFDLESGPYHDAMVANELEVLDALEHLVDKIVNFEAESRKRITIDSNGVKLQADQDLGQSARSLAEQALADKKVVKVGPLDARSRRIIHMTLREVSGVSTRSEGEGAFRRVCIVPKQR